MRRIKGMGAQEVGKEEKSEVITYCTKWYVKDLATTSLSPHSSARPLLETLGALGRSTGLLAPFCVLSGVTEIYRLVGLRNLGFMLRRRGLACHEYFGQHNF